MGTPFKMKGPSLYKNSPMKQDKMARVSKSKVKKSKVNLPYKNLTEVNGEYSYNDGDGKITMTKSEYLTAKKANAKYSQ
tara:strand:- start:415 stop:651 length:237 start_codon:yes stop_codon:yes gene_type:complete